MYQLMVHVLKRKDYIVFYSIVFQPVPDNKVVIAVQCFSYLFLCNICEKVMPAQ